MSAGPIDNLQRALRSRFPDEPAESLARLLWEILERGSIFYGQIDMPEDEREDLILFAHANRLLMPTKSGRTSAWEDKSLTLTPDESYRMPGVIAKLIKHASETGRWEPKEAILSCLREGGDKREGDKLKLFQGLKDKAQDGKVTPYTFRRVITELGLEVDIDQAIAEFKALGLISPSLHRTLSSGIIEYEINPSL